MKSPTLENSLAAAGPNCDKNTPSHVKKTLAAAASILRGLTRVAVFVLVAMTVLRCCSPTLFQTILTNLSEHPRLLAWLRWPLFAGLLNYGLELVPTTPAPQNRGQQRPNDADHIDSQDGSPVVPVSQKFPMKHYLSNLLLLKFIEPSRQEFAAILKAIRSVARDSRTPIGFVVSFLAGVLAMLLAGVVAVSFCSPSIASLIGFALRSPLVWLVIGLNLVLVACIAIPEAFPERQRGILEDFGTSRTRTLIGFTASFLSGGLVGITIHLIGILAVALTVLVTALVLG